MNRAFRIIKLVFLGLAILFCLAIPVMGLVSTAVNYHGICYGFSDGQVPCTWLEFARNEMFWTSFIFIPLLFLASLVWLGMAGFQFAVSLRKRSETSIQENNGGVSPTDISK